MWLRIICKAPWKSCTLPLICRKSPTSKERKTGSPTFHSRALIAPAAVAQLQLEVEVAVAVGPQLLVGDEENVLDAFAVGQLAHVSPGHGNSLVQESGIQEITESGTRRVKDVRPSCRLLDPDFLLLTVQTPPWQGTS